MGAPARPMTHCIARNPALSALSGRNLLGSDVLERYHYWIVGGGGRRGD